MHSSLISYALWNIRLFCLFIRFIIEDLQLPETEFMYERCAVKWATKIQFIWLIEQNENRFSHWQKLIEWFIISFLFTLFCCCAGRILWKVDICLINETKTVLNFHISYDSHFVECAHLRDWQWTDKLYLSDWAERRPDMRMN